MDVILLENVETLGDKGSVVVVSDGYARNFLLPRNLAEQASPGRIAEVRRRQEEEAAKKVRDVDRADDLAEILGKTVLTVTAQAGEDGKLFGSVTAADISKELFRARNVKIDKKKISLEEPIKETGDYIVEIEVHTGVKANAKVIVAPAGQE
ncbi:MAG: 50S ribosomal protein L9 [Thermoleophilia bacterium]|nr:50S ribosomal protein L9 [Thermoleophilia bacterium]